jgi:Tfp pilus assembly protein PilF
MSPLRFYPIDKNAGIAWPMKCIPRWAMNSHQYAFSGPQSKPVRQQPPGVMQGMLRNAIGHHQAGRLNEAERIYRQILAIDARHADSLHLLGLIASQGGHYNTAVELIGQAIRLWKHNPFYYCNMGSALKAQGRIDDAVAHFERAIVLKQDYADAYNNLGNVLAERGNPDKAAVYYGQALAVNPDHAEAHNNLGNVFKEQGKFENAMKHYERAIAIKPDYTDAHYNRAEIKTFHRSDADLVALETLARRKDLPANKAPHVHFALAKAFEDSGDYVRAFEHMSKGNALRRRQIHYDENSAVQLFQRLRNVFDHSLFDRLQGEGDPSSVPVFVLGMPRSGSTLIEQILSSHPQIHGAGELNELNAAVRGVLDASGWQAQYPECVSSLDGAALRRIGQAYLSRLPVADGKVRIVNKLPANFLSIGLIRLILPNAKIIHTVRNPIDTCLSCYSKLFTSGQHFSYDLAELGRYYRGYKELMTHWQSVLPPDAMLDVSYEDLVDDLEGQARRMIDYCGLPWDDRCLSFDKTSRTVTTASAVQVRQPLFRNSLQRWRKYEAGIGPLLQELGNDTSLGGRPAFHFQFSGFPLDQINFRSPELANDGR